MNEWRSKWFVSGQFADSTPQDLIKDMADIQSHVRLKAIGTVAKVSIISWRLYLCMYNSNFQNVSHPNCWLFKESRSV